MAVTVSQKCQYALRAVFDLARRADRNAVRIADIAETQAIPARFLEIILSELKQGGFVVSRRGNEGGYLLARPASSITVGQVIRFVDGPLGPVKCIQGAPAKSCLLQGDCAFLSMWQEVKDAVSAIYDHTTIEDLVMREQARRSEKVLNFSI